MSLRRALLLSFLAHVLVVGASGVAMESLLGQSPPSPGPYRERALELDLVAPASPELGAENLPPSGAVDRPAATNAGTRARIGGSSAVAKPESVAPPTESQDGRTAEPVVDTPLEETAMDGPLPAAGPDTPARAAPVPPGRMSPQQLADSLGLDTDGLDESVLRKMFSAMHKYALQSPRPAASTYRQLLRAWVDGLMGYPYPVLEDLARNMDRRFIGGIRIEVEADGRFRLADLWIYPDVVDPDRRLAGYYERVIRSAAEHLFLPPSDAGLPAPHGLEYRIVNPEVAR